MHRLFRTFVVAFALMVVSIGAVGSSPAPAPQLPNETPSIADLGWMAGTWVREETGGQYLEEVWTAPVNNSLTGMFRWNRGGKPWMCELMTISLDGEKPIFRLRHFDAALEPWEKEAPLIYPMAKMSENEVVFEDPNKAADHPRRFIYRRNEDKLTVRLENADGKGDEFEFMRATQGDTGGPQKPRPGSSPIDFTGGLVVRFTVTDRAKSRDWYRDMLGFEVLFEVDEIGWTEMTNHEAQLTIGLAQSDAVSVSTGTMPVIGVKDLDAARKLLESKGVKFTGATVEHAGLVKLATLLDPDGRQIMLYQALGD